MTFIQISPTQYVQAEHITNVEIKDQEATVFTVVSTRGLPVDNAYFTNVADLVNENLKPKRGSAGFAQV